MKIFTIIAHFYRKFKDECRVAVTSEFCKSYKAQSLAQDMKIIDKSTSEELRYTIGEDGEPVWLKPEKEESDMPANQEKV